MGVRHRGRRGHKAVGRRFQGASVIVIGSEGRGMGRLVSESCDFKIGIPMFGKISSLNASTSAAILLYEAVRQERAINKMRQGEWLACPKNG